MRPIGGHGIRYPRSRIRYGRSSIDGISSIEHMSQRILSPVANCQDTTFSYYQCVQKPDPRPSNIATGLWKCYAIWHSRSTPSPFGDGPALSGSHCYANSKGLSAVNDNDTATTALAARQETNRIQDTRPRAQGNLRRATSVHCLTAKPAHTETMSTIIKRASSIDVPRINLERFGRRAFACAGPTLWNNLPTKLRVNDNHTQFKKLLKTCLFST